MSWPNVQSPFRRYPYWLSEPKNCRCPLDLPDTYLIPKQADNFSSVFWLDTEWIMLTKKRADDNFSNNPFFGLAEDHDCDQATALAKRGIIDYLLRWQQRNIDAHYPGLTVLNLELVKQKITDLHG